MNSWCKNLELLIKSRTSLIWIRTKEEERLEKLINFSCERLNIKRFVCWDCVNGIKGLVNEDGKFSNNPLGVLDWLRRQSPEVSTVLLVKDFHKFYDDPSINRTIKELSSELKQTSHNLIISSHLFPSSEDLDELMTIINLPLPDQKELKNLIKKIAINTNSDLEEQDLNELSIASSGLTEIKVKQVTAKALAQRGKISKKDIKDILEEKKQVIARSEILEFFEAKSSQDDIGGLNVLKVWLNQRFRAFSKEARDYGLPIPKGVLLVGAQGTGKSLTAKSISKSWSMPLLRLDVGRLFSSLVGSSEARTRETISRAEAMSPCILWIDEIDKGFGGDARSDGGTSQRVLASLLTWMAEKESAVFVIATANAIDKLPAELLRKGRFDEIFFLDLPNSKERLSILDLHLKKRRPSYNFPLSTIVDRTDGFSGAELEQAVIEGMHISFSENRELMEKDLIKAVSELVPLSRTAKEQIDLLKEWSSTGRARSAS
ncbi:AAA family ATPase [Prochlorococcus marinus XMU1411]|uniref:AAA family ATPase n=1 Tax=Prochlorococcus marinus TaxID=1219 RepID=UPI001ADD109A|nr:AAA family ATPase [Prochlorococcus marinus]MBO8244186.1 AAA family ATPase [Prochlorococcus marinus XMU1411]MBW3055270.1 AAA family ATPase [Prochlorococcus marinus str. MU1411]MCR8537013.1 AAA family ATPase [Prochlorococcus marinus CUG1430]